MKYPEERVLVVRPCLKAICLNNKPAAKLLSALLYQARNCEDSTFTVQWTQEQAIRAVCDEFTTKTLHDTAIPILQLLGFVEVDASTYIYQYTTHLDKAQQAIEISGNKSQLELFLIQSMTPQLELFRHELELFPIQLEKVLIQLEKVLIAVRKSSNSKRGRKPASHEAQEHVFDAPQNGNRFIKIDKITRENCGSACATPPPSLAPVLEAKKEDELTPKETQQHDGLVDISMGHGHRSGERDRLSGRNRSGMEGVALAPPVGQPQETATTEPPVRRSGRARAQASPQASVPPSRKSPTPAPAEDEALTARCKAIQAKINELRGFALKKTGLIIDERKVIRDHLAAEDFTDERIEHIHQWIVTNIWKYKSPGGRGDVGARIIWEESGRAEAVIVPASTPSRPRYNEHGVDMSQYSLTALWAQQQQRQEVGQA